MAWFLEFPIVLSRPWVVVSPLSANWQRTVVYCTTSAGILEHSGPLISPPAVAPTPTCRLIAQSTPFPSSSGSRAMLMAILRAAAPRPRCLANRCTRSRHLAAYRTGIDRAVEFAENRRAPRGRRDATTPSYWRIMGIYSHSWCGVCGKAPPGAFIALNSRGITSDDCSRSTVR